MGHATTTVLASFAVHLLHRAARAADQQLARAVGPTLTPRQFAILAAVAEADGTSQIGIVDATGIDRSTTAELVYRLVSRGLLQRRRAKRDTRLFSVRLTPKGRELFDKLQPAVKTADEVILNRIAWADRPKLKEALELIAKVTESQK